MRSKWTIQQIATIDGQPFYELREPLGSVNETGFMGALIAKLRRMGVQADLLPPRKEGDAPPNLRAMKRIKAEATQEFLHPLTVLDLIEKLSDQEASELEAYVGDSHDPLEFVTRTCAWLRAWAGWTGETTSGASPDRPGTPKRVRNGSSKGPGKPF